MSTAPGPGPLSVAVLGDSTAFIDDTGPQLPTAAHLYPNVLARQLEDALGRPVAVTVCARPGQTVRDAARAVLKDQHLQFDVLAKADAVVVGLGSFDHAPAGVPAALEATLPYLWPAPVRRRARAWSRAAYPQLVRLTGARLRRTPATEFVRLFSQLLEQVRGLTWGRAAGVVLGPTSHRSAYYGHRHPRFADAEAQQLALARAHGFAGVAVWEHVVAHLDGLNVDGIHWPPAAHAAVGRAAAEALLPQLLGAAPRIGLPHAAEAAGITLDGTGRTDDAGPVAARPAD
ncbi:GDSL-type esterase/lipase family protein [Egicoccus sp. AB-alg2]|uniref:GDSL-type esterase/lipase family protein n=1 Tax=Egicoccus sp. AB-alg2 TaxID=3242693 RepID=UPI00359CFADC